MPMHHFEATLGHTDDSVGLWQYVYSTSVTEIILFLNEDG